MLSWTKTRLLPKIFASVEQIFDFKSCRFKQDKYKLSTARVVVWNEMKVTNSFTLETSMFAKFVQRKLRRKRPESYKPPEGEEDASPASPQGFDTEMYHC